MRPIAATDARWLLAARDDVEVVRYTDLTADLTVEAAERWIARRVEGWEQGWRAGFVIETVGADSAGYINLRINWGSGSGVYGWWLLAAHRGKGLMTEAVALVRDWAFDSLGIARLEAQIQPANTASAAVVERLGFQREGLLRSSDVLKGVRHDHWLFALLAADPRA